MPLSRLALFLYCLLAALPAGAHSGLGIHFHVLAAGSGGVDGYTVEMGSCAGKAKPAAPVPSGGPAFDIKTAPWLKDWKQNLGLAGYTLDEKTSHMLDPQGKPLTEAQAAHLFTPFEAASETLGALEWVSLTLDGARLDEATCRLMRSTSTAVSHIEVILLSRMSRLQLEHAALESLRVQLRGLDPASPLPSGVLAKVQQVQGAGVTLPEGVRKLLEGGTVKVGALASQVEKDYAASTRFWDGQKTLEAFKSGAEPVVPGKNEPARPGTYVGDVEAKLGKSFSADLLAHFGESPAGRDLLEHFKDKKGAVQLPDFMLLKLSQKASDPGYGLAAAVQNPANGSIIINHWYAAQVALELAPEAERKKLSADFSDTGKLTRYLLDHPKARDAVVERIDVVLYHEMIHSWQNRRSNYDVEMMRGNLPGANPLSKEHEAYREEFRYFHEKLMKDPAGMSKDPLFPQYLSMLKDYDGFREDITRLYMSNFAGSSDYKTLGQIQEERRGMAQKLMGDGLYARTIQTLKLVGLSFGDKALKENQDDAQKREAEFTGKVLPELRSEGYDKLASHFTATGRPDQALSLLTTAMATAMPSPALLKAYDASVAYLRGTRLPGMAGKLFVSKPSEDELDRRLKTCAAVVAYLEKTKEPLPADLAEIQARDYRLAAEFYLARAEKTKDPALRANALEWAEAYAGGLGAKGEDLKAKVKEMREGVKK